MANLVAETRTVSDFDRIRLEGNVDATLIQDDTESVTIEVEANLLDRVKTEVGGGELVIGYKSWLDYVFGVKTIRAQIHLKNFRELHVSGSGEVEAASLHSDRVRFGVSGSGKIIVKELAATDLEALISGTGEFDLTGQVTTQDIQVSGSSKYNAEKLDSQDVEVRISGSARVAVRAARKLDVSISGSGDVAYFGTPLISQRISGSARVHPIDAS